MSYKPLQNKKITVVGAELSGLSAAVFLKQKGNQVFLTELNPKEKIKHDLNVLDKNSIPYEVGGHTNKAFNADVFVVSPGVPDAAPIIVKAVEKGIPIISEIEAGFQFFKKPIIAITGTNGKTTTTALIGHLLDIGNKKPLVAGNIGEAFTATESEWEQKDVGVLEISSFQLDHMDTFRPKISVLLNITPDHLDRYKTYNHYIQSKINITENQTSADTFIYNADSEVIAPYLNSTQAEKLPFSIEKPLTFGAWVENGNFVVRLTEQNEIIMPTNELFIKGKHNQYNALAAILAAKKSGVPNNIIAEGLRSFKGVEHRLEFVRSVNGVDYYNDSKATNIDSLNWALTGFSSSIILIAGGRDYGKNNYKDLETLIKKQVREIIAIGEAANKIYEDLNNIAPVTHASSLKTAVLLGKEKAKTGEVVLFSPACKSFDMFIDYKDRGKQFKALVNELNS